MATRCFIGKSFPDGTIHGIYCHYDGYPEYTGLRLEAHYTDPTKIDALLALGSISQLNDEIGEAHDFNDAAAHPNWTKAYHRDRGEDLSPNHMYFDVGDMKDNVGSDLGAEYAYVWNTGRWNTYKI